ncbi:MAG: phytoene desaturase family protein [Myxococcota bacterium]
MTTKRVAIIGGGIGGLSAAGELARAGHAVTLFEGADTLGGKAQVFTHDGLTLDTGPTLLTMPATVREQFARLGALDLLPRFHRLALQSQYRYADGKDFFCWEDLDRAADSAAAIHPADGDGLRAFSREAEIIYRAAGEPYLEAAYEGMAGFMARVLKRGPATVFTGLKLSTLDTLARKHFASEHLRQFAGRFATYTGGSPYEASAAFAMIPHIERAFGVSHVEGGMGALVRALGEAVRRAGVTVHLGAKAGFEQRGTRFVAGPSGGEAEFDAVVVNADPLALTGRAREPLSMSGYVFFVDVPARLRLPHHLIVFSSDYRKEFDELFAGQVPTEPTLYVCHPAATDATMAPEGRSGLFVMVNVPAFTDRAEAERDWPAHAERLWAFAVDRLRAHFAELRDVDLRVVGERTPIDLANRGAPGGSIYGFLPHGKLGPFRRPRMKGRQPGLFFAGGGTHPGGGVPLVMLSGRFAAGLARRHLEGRA